MMTTMEINGYTAVVSDHRAKGWASATLYYPDSPVVAAFFTELYIQWYQAEEAAKEAAKWLALALAAGFRVMVYNNSGAQLDWKADVARHGVILFTTANSSKEEVSIWAKEFIDKELER